MCIRDRVTAELIHLSVAKQTKPIRNGTKRSQSQSSPQRTHRAIQSSQTVKKLIELIENRIQRWRAVAQTERRVVVGLIQKAKTEIENILRSSDPLGQSSDLTDLRAD